MQQVLKSVDCLIAVSNSTMQITLKTLDSVTPSGEWSVNFNGLSYRNEALRFERRERDGVAPVRILSFCRLAERKNIKGCLEALAILRDAGIQNFEYKIAGTGPLKNQIAKQIDALGLGAQVQMTGYVRDEDIPDLYRNSDIFLHPQTAADTGRDLEGFGLAIADAISFGVAAIVGKDGGPADFVKHSEYGLVVDGNQPREIASGLRLLLTNPALRDQIARKGREWCLGNLSWDRHVAQILVSLRFESAATQTQLVSTRVPSERPKNPD
jgi:glycosyltransferase involved in cell wall biosynthesis